ncbi:MAG: hypothetical protein JRS35_22315 [Deltaproteobacteria bacterium]|nr:hypothetical protein [Deltaproteobacteria bacterium]
MLQPITQAAIVVLALALAWRLERQERVKPVREGKKETARAVPSKRQGVGTKVAWSVGRDLDNEGPIRERLGVFDWFTATDVARALQNASDGRRPSGSAGRDARDLIDRWRQERVVEVGRPGHSGRRVYRFI